MKRCPPVPTGGHRFIFACMHCPAGARKHRYGPVRAPVSPAGETGQLGPEAPDSAGPQPTQPPQPTWPAVQLDPIQLQQFVAVPDKIHAVYSVLCPGKQFAQQR